MIKAEVIADSTNGFGNRLTTMIVTFPRFILAEFNTHRMFSRNSASSRAIPFEKMVKSVEENPFIPMAWQRDHKGMQGTEYLTAPIDIAYANDMWLKGRDEAIRYAKRLHHSAADHSPFVTKQLCNRMLEPYMWHTCIVSATEWKNFFALRCPQYQLGENLPIHRSKKDATKYLDEGLGEGVKKDSMPFDWSDFYWLQHNLGAAEIHMMALAEAMWDAYNDGTPRELEPGEWHIPFGDNININNEGFPVVMSAQKEADWHSNLQMAKVKIATARCAGVSYTIAGEDGKSVSYEKLIARHDNLAKAGHWSPFEHCAKNSVSADELIGKEGNFRGFVQYRKMFDNENITA